METKCTKAEPGKSVFSQGGQKGVTHKSKCKNCGQPIEKHFGDDAKVKRDEEWHHAGD